MKANCSTNLIKKSAVTSNFSYRYIKRGLDILCAGIVLLVFSPLFAFIGLLIKLSSKGPVFYRWDVIGFCGRPFHGYKFRTMVENADQLRKKLEKLNERKGPTFKLQNDPRVTKVGRILRKFSLDELPQLWSVLKGDMSLVGPRPVGPHEWKKFEEAHRRKLSVIPGCISPWHVWGKSKEFDDWIRCELDYIDHWSLWKDLKILLGGVWYIITGKNY